MKCRFCQTENKLTAKHCVSCGKAISSTLDDLTEDSSKQHRLDQIRKAETVLFRILVVIILIMIPAVFFYYFLPEPEADDMFVTVGFPSVEITYKEKSDSTAENSGYTAIDLNPFKTNGYITFRNNPEAKRMLVEMFSPGGENRIQEKLPALKWLAGTQQREGFIGNIVYARHVTPIALLALLSQGLPPGEDSFKSDIEAGFSFLYNSEKNLIRSNQTIEYALTLLALTEYALLNPEFITIERYNALCKNLSKYQDKTSGAFRVMLSRQSGTDVIPSLYALLVLGEASRAGLYTFADEDLKTSLKYLLKYTSEAYSAQAKLTPKNYHLRALAVYDAVLLSSGTPDRVVLDDINYLIANTFEDAEQGTKIPVSYIGAYYMLMALHRSCSTYFSEFRDNLFNAYDILYRPEKKSWEAPSNSLFLSTRSPELATAVVLRTYAFPYLYPLLDK